jgi:hypothetical protein
MNAFDAGNGVRPRSQHGGSIQKYRYVFPTAASGLTLSVEADMLCAEFLL